VIFYTVDWLFFNFNIKSAYKKRTRIQNRHSSAYERSFNKRWEGQKMLRIGDRHKGEGIITIIIPGMKLLKMLMT
jgi:hypothetical protein